MHRLYGRTRARERAEIEAERRLEAALDHLERLPATAAKYRFLRLSRYLTRRTR